MSAAAINDVVHETSRNESLLMQFKRNPAEVLDELDAANKLSEKEYDALASRDENQIHEKVGGIRADVLIAVAVTIVRN